MKFKGKLQACYGKMKVQSWRFCNQAFSRLKRRNRVSPLCCFRRTSGNVPSPPGFSAHSVELSSPSTRPSVGAGPILRAGGRQVVGNTPPGGRTAGKRDNPPDRPPCLKRDVFFEKRRISYHISGPQKLLSQFYRREIAAA